MPRHFLKIFSLLVLLAGPSIAWADPPVVSGNGFSCVKSQMLVTCQGQFPGVPGIQGATGSFGVQIQFETTGPTRQRFLFDSTTGCLMQISMTPAGDPIQVLVKSASGKSQSFPLPAQQMPAFEFCKS